mmetsp:Transcript_548/g.1617  ORF Transcript_548/g.1617 Transcript_548/m.1617 type:complete len:763 (-) Transcript_548:41-2329(-)
MSGMLRGGKSKSQLSLASSGPPLEDALNEMKDQLNGLEQQLAELASQQDLEEGLAAQARVVDDKFGALTEKMEDELNHLSMRQTDELLALRKENEGSLKGSEEMLQRVDALAQQLAQLQGNVSGGFSDASARHQKAEDQLLATAEKLAKLEKLTATAERRCFELEAALTSGLSAQRAEAEAQLSRAMAHLSTRCEVLQGGLDGLTGDIALCTTTTEKRLEEGGARVEAELRRMQEALPELQQSIVQLEDRQAKTLESVDLDMQAHVAAMRLTVELAENVFTRSVVWQARGFKKRLHDLLHQEDQTIRSPGFFISALPEMKIELQMASRDDAGENTAFGPSLPLPGSCSVGVWAPAGLRACFRITAGEGAGAVSRRYEHAFHAEEGRRVDEAGRVLFVVQNFCRLNHIWIRREDRVRVSFEILDFEAAPMTVLPGMLPVRGGAALFADAGPAEEAFGSDAVGDESAVSVAAARPPSAAVSPAASSPASPASARPPSEERPRPPLADPDADVCDVAGGDITSLGFLDALQYLRGATSQELVQERLQSELHAVKNRSVRRVEWRLEGCARLLESRVGEAVDSPLFSAAGLEKIQFHFYPRDTTATGSNSQPCGLFVSGPSKTSLKAMLWVGSFSRQLDHRFNKRGEIGGRTRFCSLENQVDCNDSVVIAIDIIEVEADMPEQSRTSLCLRDARDPNSAKGGGAGPGGGVAHAPQTSSPVKGTRGTLSMKRDDPSKTEEFVRCVSLPTLNARQLKMPLALKCRPGS